VIELIKKLLIKYKHFVKYSIVGVIGTIIDVGSLYLMVQFSKIDPNTNKIFYLFVSIAFLLAVLNNYVLNKIWTFRDKSTNIKTQFLKFLLVSIIGYLLTYNFMWLFVSVMHIWYILAKLLTSGIVLIWNFLANKYWTFKSAIIQQI
jgi:putative flippase GtrA